jgi:hypothetical protein
MEIVLPLLIKFMDVHYLLNEERAIQVDVDIFSGPYVSANILDLYVPCHAYF